MRKKRIIILVIYSLVVLIGFSQTSLAYKNEVHRHPLPDSPEKYTFFHNPYLLPNEIPNDMKTDYGTHDWIADAALRLLYQLNPSDWDWLLDNPSDPNPSWKSNYGLNGYHHAVRSYIYYLLATQWPDFENAPAVIHFKNEGEQIKNGIHNLKTWIGRTDYHTYHFNVYKHSTIENYFYFIPKLPSKEGSDQHPQEAPQYAQRFGDLAIECLSHQEDGESWAKVETAAFYLGCMTHYIADLACPPHLLSPTDKDSEGQVFKWYSINPSFHQWFEGEVKKFTYWGTSSGSDAGPNTNFFNINIDPISIVPIPAGIAALTCAIDSIIKSFGEVGGGSTGTSPLGLFIIDDHSNIINNWIWEEIQRSSYVRILPNGVTRKHYFDKVEDLLNTAVYYTACAMKWVMDQVKKRTNNALNPDQWAKVPFPEKENAQPIFIPNPDIPEEEQSKESQFGNIEDPFMTAAMLAPIFALAIIPVIIPFLTKIS